MAVPSSAWSLRVRMAGYITLSRVSWYVREEQTTHKQPMQDLT
jgi:hypothetical protein